MRYRLLAYVCDRNCVKWVDNEGTLEFGDILLQRPSDCRYAILEKGDTYYALDLHETEIDRNLIITEPVPHAFPDMDAAIMYAQHHM